MAQRIAIIGNLNIDLIIRGVSHLPAWGQEALGSSHVAASAGQAGNLALALARLALPVSVISALGNDEFGRQIHRDLDQAGVDLTGVERQPGGRTAVAVAIVREDGERAFVSDFSPLDHFDQTLVDRHQSILANAEIVCLVGIFCLPRYSLTDMTVTLRTHQQAGRTTMLDTGWDPDNWQPATLAALAEVIAVTDCFLPNLDEARAITGLADPISAARSLAAMGPDTVVVKCGDAGAVAVRGGEIAHCPALATVVADAVGAGDTFNAGFLYALDAGWTLPQALAFANATAALYIARPNERFPDVESVMEKMAEYTTIPLPERPSR